MLTKHGFFLLTILVLTVFFRVFRLNDFYGFGHDQDLLAWIAKDILVDGHLRLIGQETSIIGVFIGPLYYYLIVPFLALFKMNPLSMNFPAVIISVFTSASIYFVFSRLFTKSTGLIGAFIYAVSLGAAFLDRWIVPTQPTILWSIWFMYVCFSLAKGSIKVLPILAALVGLIWHIHIAFIPLLVLLPIALYLSPQKFHTLKKLNLKIAAVSLLTAFLLMSPFFIFEARHNFGQVRSMILSVSEDRGTETGFNRFEKIISAVATSLDGAVVLNSSQIFSVFIIPIVELALFGYLSYTRKIPLKFSIILSLWIAINLISHMISKRAISEYYFNNLFVIVYLVWALFLEQIQKYVGGKLIFLLLCSYLMVNLYGITNLPKSQYSFSDRESVVKRIKEDSLKYNYPCVAINYIADPGWASGFFYLYWMYDLKRITPGNDVAVYNVVVPFVNASEEINYRSGIIGLILPDRQKKHNPDVCDLPERKVLGIWGFNN